MNQPVNSLLPLFSAAFATTVYQEFIGEWKHLLDQYFEA
jgi:hypothetical protein